MTARAGWDQERQRGLLEVVVPIGYAGEPIAGGEICLDVLDAAGESILAAPATQPVAGGTDRHTKFRLRADFRLEFDNVAPWSAELPVLYRVVVEYRALGASDAVSCRVGFRSIEIRDRNLLVNGQRIAIRGVNRHDHDDTRGKALTRARMLEDVVQIKRFNFNAVRTSHYPNDPYFLDLCDEHGVYVIDEANIEAHAFHNFLCEEASYSTAWLERTARMVQRDQNHPSIIFWSLGNESGYGPNHDAAAGWVRRHDPTRPLHYEGVVSSQSGRTLADRGAATDIVCPMYTSPDDIRAWARTPDDRPLILCEYSHAMGNSNGGLAEYFDVFDNVPGVQGGFIWEWLDHGIQRTDERGKYWVYGGDFGDTPSDVNFCCDGLVWPDRQPHPGVFEFMKLAQPVKVERADGGAGFNLTNRQHFRSLDWLRGEWEVLVDGQPVESGALPIPAIEPQACQFIPWPVRLAASEGREACLSVRFFVRQEQSWCEAGHLLGWEQLAFPEALKSPRAEPPAAMAAANLQITSAGGAVTVRTNTLELFLDAGRDGLVALRKASVDLLAAPPMLNVWRAPTDNDGIKLWTGQDQKALGRWNKLGLSSLRSRCLGLRESPETDGGWELAFEASGRDDWADVRWSLRLRFLSDCSLRVAAEFLLGEEMRDLPRVGLLFPLAAGYEDLSWYGLGPWDNYPDRLAAAYLAVHRSTVSAQYVPYILPQEHGLKCQARWVELSGFSLPVLRVAGLRPFAFSASHFAAADLTAARHTVDLHPREQTFLCLDAAHRGLGTGSCGPDTFEKYRVSESAYALTFDLTL